MSEKAGCAAITEAVSRCRPPVIVVEMMRMFGDVLHSTIVVRHYRSARPDASIVWAISERYVSTFEPWVGPGPHAIAALPDGVPYPADGPMRVAWVRCAAKLPSVERAIGCGVHPWGWKGGGDIVSAIFRNANISRLAVLRRPWCPWLPEDERWVDSFLQEHRLTHFAALEFESVSLASLTAGDVSKLVSGVDIPVVALGAPGTALPDGVIDGRCTFRQARTLIDRATCFIGIGSGLTQLSATTSTPVIEMSPRDLSLQNIGYVHGRVYRHVGSISEVIGAVKDLVPVPHHPTILQEGADAFRTSRKDPVSKRKKRRR